MKLTKTRLGLVLAAMVIVVPSMAVAVSPFVDVAPGKFYEAPINWAFDNGITNGKDTTHFGPEDAVTRGESVTFLKRYNDFIAEPADTALGTRIGGVEASVANLGQTVGTLNCTTNQVAHYDGANWVCGTATPTYSLTTRAATASDSVGDVGQDTSMAIGADNNPIISYRDATNTDLKIHHCADTACTTGTATTLDATGNVGRETSITVGTDGFPVISYRDAINQDLKVYHCTNTACTAGAATALDTNGAVGFDTSVTIGTDGFPIISYYDSSKGALKVYHCTNTACTTGAATALGANGTGGQYTSITIGSDGFPIISYYDGGVQDLKAYHCTNTACDPGTSVGAAFTLDSTDNVGAFTSITIGSDGFPIISYYDSTNGDLKAYHCTNTACDPGTSVGAATTLDATGNVGQDTSIAIGVDNNPIISYFDGTVADLKVYHCADTACATGAATTLVATGTVGFDTSIVIGVDNNPIISYYDGTDFDLKVVVVGMFVSGIAFG